MLDFERLHRCKYFLAGRRRCLQDGFTIWRSTFLRVRGRREMQDDSGSRDGWLRHVSC